MYKYKFKGEKKYTKILRKPKMTITDSPGAQ